MAKSVVPDAPDAAARAEDPEFFDKMLSVSDILINWIPKGFDLTKSRILDLGCGEGETALGMALKTGATEVVGIDLKDSSKRLALRAKKNINLKKLPSNLNILKVEPGDLPDGRFNFIYSWSVVEHIDLELLPSTLSGLYDKLENDGLMMVQIAPLFYSAFGHHVSWKEDFAWKHLSDQMNHFENRIDELKLHPADQSGLETTYKTLNRITAEELKDRLEQAGFFIEKQYRSDNIVDPPESLSYAFRPEVIRCEQVVYLCRKLPRDNRPKRKGIASLASSIDPMHAGAVRKLGTWWSDLPTLDVGVGKKLFTENSETRICIESNGSLDDFLVLEIGPRDGYHTYAMEKSGAQVLAFEQDYENYLRCIHIKNQYDLKSKFVFGPVEDFIDSIDGFFDLAFLSGVIYHFHDPIELLKKILWRTDRTYVWTHVFDQTLIDGNAYPRADGSLLKDQFKRVEKRKIDGVEYRYHELQYETVAYEESSFSGGVHRSANWLEKDQLLSFFEKSGFEVRELAQFDHSGGPAVQFSAKRVKPRSGMPS